MTAITSRDNAQFKVWKSLLSSKGIKKEGLFLISGEKLIAEALRDNKLAFEAELLGPQHEPLAGVPRSYRLTSELFRELDEIGTHHPLILARAPEIPAWEESSLPAGLEIFTPLGDPQNLGALLRSAEAFGATRVILLQESANPFLPKTLKASSGAGFRVPLARGPALSELKGNFVALDIAGQDIAAYRFSKNLRMLVGEEGQGFRALNAGAKIERLSIRTQGVESLNATISASIALYQYRTQFPL